MGFEIAVFTFANVKTALSLLALAIAMPVGYKFVRSALRFETTVPVVGKGDPKDIKHKVVGLQKPSMRWSIALGAILLVTFILSGKGQPVVRLDTGGVVEERPRVSPGLGDSREIIIPRIEQQEFDDAIEAREEELRQWREDQQ